jgi:protein O-GlcNAc transferase
MPSPIDTANAALLSGNVGEAQRLIAHFLKDQPEHAGALHLAALAAGRLGQYRQAIPLLRRAVERSPGNRTWWSDLATLQCAAGHWDDAAATFECCARVGELSAQSLRALAIAYRKTGRLELSIKALKRCLAIDSNLLAARRELAGIFSILGYRDRELQQREQIAALAPHDSGAVLALGRAQFQRGKTRESLRTILPVLTDKPSAELHSEFLGMLLHDPSQNARSLRNEHERWGRTFADARAPRPIYRNSRDANRRLRIGYVCGEFASAPSFHFLLPLLRLRDRERFEVTCYHANFEKDGRSRQFQREADRWRDISARADRDVCRQIRQDGIDILINLSGHYVDHRLPLFALRPAPVQAVFPNYPCTTGVPAIDFIFTDPWACPEGDEAQDSEQPIRSDSGYLTYQPPRSPRLTKLPAGRNEPLTFGVFQRAAKFTRDFWDAAARILGRCPGSRILIQHASNDLEDRNAPVRTELFAFLAARGIEGNRIFFRGPVSRSQNLEAFADVDIALDTFPYNGQTTTCECLWMGVPVITLAGDYHVARVGLSIVSSIGHPELAAHSVREYVETAVRLAEDRARLIEYRRRLRRRMRASPLVDGRSVAALESQYRRLWSECAMRIR